MANDRFSLTREAMTDILDGKRSGSVALKVHVEGIRGGRVFLQVGLTDERDRPLCTMHLPELCVGDSCTVEQLERAVSFKFSS